MRPETGAAVCLLLRLDDSRKAKPAARPNRIEISDFRIMNSRLMSANYKCPISGRQKVASGHTSPVPLLTRPVLGTLFSL